MACFSPGNAGQTATPSSAVRRTRHEMLVVIGCQ